MGAIQRSVAVATFVHKYEAQGKGDKKHTWMLEFLLSLVDDNVCGLMLILENIKPALTLSWQSYCLVIRPRSASKHRKHSFEP